MLWKEEKKEWKGLRDKEGGKKEDTRVRGRLGFFKYGRCRMRLGRCRI